MKTDLSTGQQWYSATLGNNFVLNISMEFTTGSGKKYHVHSGTKLLTLNLYPNRRRKATRYQVSSGRHQGAPVPKNRRIGAHNRLLVGSWCHVCGFTASEGLLAEADAVLETLGGGGDAADASGGGGHRFRW